MNVRYVCSIRFVQNSAKTIIFININYSFQTIYSPAILTFIFFNYSERSLIQMNNIVDKNLYPGQVLKIPPGKKGGQSVQNPYLMMKPPPEATADNPYLQEE